MKFTSKFILILSCLSVIYALITNNIEKQNALHNFSPVNITSNLLDWEYDSAILFYAPWCKYCKQLLPSWETIAELSKDNNNLIVGTFDCEASEKNELVCKKLNVDRYPSLYYIGYGNFNQAPNGKLVGKTINPRIVQYVADIYPEAVYDWVTMLSFLSKVNRKWDDFIGIFTGKSYLKTKLNMYKNRVEDAEKKSFLFGKELERYKAIEVFDQLEDRGDPFPLLHSLEPDKQNLPLRVCVAEMASEFCRFYETEPYCKIWPVCVDKDLEPLNCRPEICPFQDKRGCIVTSTCLSTDVIQEYKKALSIK